MPSFPQVRSCSKDLQHVSEDRAAIVPHKKARSIAALRMSVKNLLQYSPAITGLDQGKLI